MILLFSLLFFAACTHKVGNRDTVQENTNLALNHTQIAELNDKIKEMESDANVYITKISELTEQNNTLQKDIALSKDEYQTLQTDHEDLLSKNQRLIEINDYLTNQERLLKDEKLILENELQKERTERTISIDEIIKTGSIDGFDVTIVDKKPEFKITLEGLFLLQGSIYMCDNHLYFIADNIPKNAISETIVLWGESWEIDLKTYGILSLDTPFVKELLGDMLYKELMKNQVILFYDEYTKPEYQNDYSIPVTALFQSYSWQHSGKSFGYSAEMIEIIQFMDVENRNLNSTLANDMNS